MPTPLIESDFSPVVVIAKPFRSIAAPLVTLIALAPVPNGLVLPACKMPCETTSAPVKVLLVPERFRMSGPFLVSTRPASLTTPESVMFP